MSLLFLNKKKLFALITLIIIGSGIYLRLYPVTRNAQHQAETIARLSVYVSIKNQLQKQISLKNPDFSASQKEFAVTQLFKKTISEEQERVKNLIQALAASKDNPFRKSYLLGADSFYYFSITDRLIENGLFSFPMRHGKYFDALMRAPEGYWRNWELHPYLGYMLHKTLSLFNPSFSLSKSVSCVPLILFSLSVILFIKTSHLFPVRAAAKIIAGFFFALAPIYIARSSYGWFDTDPYNIIFSLVTFYFLLRITQANGKRLFIFFLAGSHSLYSLFWQGWIILPFFTVLTFAVILMKSVHDKTARIFWMQQIAFYAATLTLLTCAILTPQGFINSFSESLSLFTKYFFMKTSWWPDIFLTVGELKNPSLKKFIHLLGGYVFITAALLGVFSLLRSRHAEKKVHNFSLVLIINSVFFIVMAKSAERFILFALPALSLLSIVGINTLFSWGLFLVSRLPPKKTVHATILVQSFPFLLLISPFLYGHLSATRQVPIYNQVWEEALTTIKNHTPADTIVTTWWPPGHFIKAIAHRPVTFDGATLELPQSYWVARFFLSTSEKEALGILRMLTLSGNKAFEFLQSLTISPLESIKILNAIFPLTRTQASLFLDTYLAAQDRDYLLTLTHATPSHALCLTYNDLVENILGLYYVRNWDFSKTSRIDQDRVKALKKGNLFWRGTQENIGLIWSVSGGMTYISKEVFETKREGDTVFFPNGVTFSLSKNNAFFHNLEGKISGRPQSIFFLHSGELKEKTNSGNFLKLSLLLLAHDDNKLSCIIAPRDILNSIIVRMYYLNGADLTHFTQAFSFEDARLNTKICGYAVTW